MKSSGSAKNGLRTDSSIRGVQVNTPLRKVREGWARPGEKTANGNHEPPQGLDCQAGAEVRHGTTSNLGDPFVNAMAPAFPELTAIR